MDICPDHLLMTISNVSVKVCGLSDLKQLTGLGARTFYESFADQNAEEDMQKYLEENLNTTQMFTELSDPASMFIMAVHDTKPVGYAKLRTSKIPDELADRKVIEIERLYVLRTHQNMKIGALLMQYCINHALSNNFECIWLGVWEHNDKALSFYKQWGFVKFGTQIFNLGNDSQIDWLLKKEIAATLDR